MELNKAFTFLEHVGQEFKAGAVDVAKAFAKVAPIIQEAEPYVNVTFPGFGPLFAATVNEVVSTEQKFAAIGQQTGSGKDKLASVLAVIQPVAAQIFAQAKLPNDEATITNWINGVVGLLKGVPAPTSAPAAAAQA